MKWLDDLKAKLKYATQVPYGFNDLDTVALRSDIDRLILIVETAKEALDWADGKNVKLGVFDRLRTALALNDVLQGQRQSQGQESRCADPK